MPQRPWIRDRRQSAGDDSGDVADWLPACVPGNVRSDLLALARIPDPLAAGGLAASRWTERVDWWYRAALPLGLPPGQRAILEFDGIDYLSAVHVAGVELGRHQGMFARQVYEIPAGLCRQDQVALAVRIWGSDALPAYRLSRWERAWGRVAGRAGDTFQPFDDRLATLKTPMHYGWDFAPRLRTMGVWDEARLVMCRGVYLAHVGLQAEPLALPADPGPARLRVGLDLDSDRERAVVVRLQVLPYNFTAGQPVRFDFQITLRPGRGRHDLEATLPAARLWHPWERGQPCLYELQVELLDLPSDGQDTESPLDSLSTIFGVRRVERRPLAGQGAREPGWQFLVNGQPLFLRGANWVPVDALQGRARPQHYASLLSMAREAGLNFLRVWGGGGREKRAFYRQCDELGLLVWQEFPIACVFLDHLPRSDDYLRLLRREATGIVQALRNHPCLFLWCGGNEFSPLRNGRAVAVLAEVVAAQDGTRPWVPASPGLGDAHNWLVWHGKAPLGAYRNEQAAFVSEFGLQAAPDMESLRCFLRAGDLWPPGPAWERHKADLAKLGRYAAWFRDDDAADAPAALESFVAATQRAQAAGLQIMVEHLRRRAGQCGGLAVWQWNEPAPAICWSVIDAYGRPKAAYDTLRRIMQPLLVSLEYPLRAYLPGDVLNGTLWVVNDDPEDVAGGRLLAFLDDDLVFDQACSLAGHGATRAGPLSLSLPHGFRRLRLEFRKGNTLLAANVYDLRDHDGGSGPAVEVLRRRLVDWVLR